MGDSSATRAAPSLKKLLAEKIPSVDEFVKELITTKEWTTSISKCDVLTQDEVNHLIDTDKLAWGHYKDQINQLIVEVLQIRGAEIL